MNRRIVAAGILIGSLAVSATAGRVMADDHDAARHLREMGDIVPLETILAAIHIDHPGQVIEVELERKDGRHVYEIEVLRPDGSVLELYYDARTGNYLGSEL